MRLEQGADLVVGRRLDGKRRGSGGRRHPGFAGFGSLHIAGDDAAVRPRALDAGHVLALQASLRAGLAAIPAIASQYNDGGAERAARNESYLRNNIVYTLGEDEIRGLREFYRRAHGAGLLPRVPELRFHGHR